MITEKKYPRLHPKLGRHVKHDSRSLEYPFDVTGLTIRSVVWPRHIPILDQGDIGSCVANAAIGDLATDPEFPAVPSTCPYSLDEPGAVKLYSDLETEDGYGPYPPNDNGSTALTAGKVLLRAGVISGYKWCFDARSALRALSVLPFMFGTVWTEHMFRPDTDGRVHPEGSIMGGHEIYCREFDMHGPTVWKGSRLYFDNSWGESWGLAGRFYLTLADFEILLAQQGDVVLFLPLKSDGVLREARQRRRRHHRAHRNTRK